MDYELTKMLSGPENLTVSEDASVDEAVPINIIKQKNKKAYKETTIKDIENIDTYETIKKVSTTKWRPIYEVIYEVYIEYSKIFPDNFIT